MIAGVVLAGGRGERMGAGINKALLPLRGRPLLLYSIETLLAVCDQLVVVAAEVDVPAIQRLTPDLAIIPGGATRHGSEWNALRFLEPRLDALDIVAIHDAARPLVHEADVAAVLAAATANGAALLAAPSAVPALEMTRGHVERVHPKGSLWCAQTPQAARLAWLIEAYRRAFDDGFDGTDTASVLARAGYPVHLVAAGFQNPKITLPADLPRAEALLG